LKIKVSGFRDVRCTGATLADLSAPRSTDEGTNPARFDALSGATRLVTLSIGGNGIGFASVIRRCVTSGVLYEVTGGRDGDAPCRDRYLSGGRDEVRKKIEAADGRLAPALDEVRGGRRRHGSMWSAIRRSCRPTAATAASSRPSPPVTSPSSGARSGSSPPCCGSAPGPPGPPGHGT
jgi:hypothetical protein